MIEGRLLKVNRFGKKLMILFILTNGKVNRCVYRGENKTLKPNDYLRAAGNWRVFKEQSEFHITEILFLKENKTLKSLKRTAVYERLTELEVLQKLYARKVASQVVHSELASSGFLPCQSPTITGNWVEGNTQPFKVAYYDYPAYLSISNSLFHQIAISTGYSKIYELGKLHRSETPSTRKKLAEFTILDISQTFVSVQELTTVFEKTILAIHQRLVHEDLFSIKLIETPTFDTIEYNELLKRVGLPAIKGSQFTKEIRAYLDTHFDSFIWVTGFHKNTRPFYIKHDEKDHCLDCQLWYKGEFYLAAGGAIETDFNKIKGRMAESNKEEKKYKFYLDFVNAGLPEMCSIGMGLELLLSCLVKKADAADFALFPKYKNQMAP